MFPTFGALLLTRTCCVRSTFIRLLSVLKGLFLNRRFENKSYSETEQIKNVAHNSGVRKLVKTGRQEKHKLLQFPHLPSDNTSVRLKMAFYCWTTTSSLTRFQEIRLLAQLLNQRMVFLPFSSVYFFIFLLTNSWCVVYVDVRLYFSY